MEKSYKQPAWLSVDVLSRIQQRQNNTMENKAMKETGQLLVLVRAAALQDDTQQWMTDFF